MQLSERFIGSRPSSHAAPHPSPREAVGRVARRVAPSRVGEFAKCHPPPGSTLRVEPPSPPRLRAGEGKGSVRRVRAVSERINQLWHHREPTFISRGATLVPVVSCNWPLVTTRSPGSRPL